MPNRAQRIATGRTGYNTLRPSSQLDTALITCITSCTECEFGERTSGDSIPSSRVAPVIVHALRTVRKHVALSGHSAHLRVIETRQYSPSRKLA